MNNKLLTAPSWVFRLKMFLGSFFKKKSPSYYEQHAKRELQALGYKLDEKEEGPNKWVVENIMELLQVFAKQGNSGSSAPYVADLFAKLAVFAPLCALTGEDSEWVEVRPKVWQNNRCSHVFKDADGRAYDIDGRIFREPNGVCYTNYESLVYITFPYTPSRVYVDVDYEK